MENSVDITVHCIHCVDLHRRILNFMKFMIFRAFGLELN